MYLNGKARANHISEKTCARIEEVIRRENYQPNVNARAMAMKRTNLVGCVMRDSLESSFWADILAGIDEMLAPENIHLLLTVSSGGLEAEMQAFEFLRAKGVDSYIWIPTVKRDGSNNYEQIREFSAERPVVTLTSLVESPSMMKREGVSPHVIWQNADTGSLQLWAEAGCINVANISRKRHKDSVRKSPRSNISKTSRLPSVILQQYSVFPI